MFDTEAIFDWVLGNLYIVGGAVGATLLITLAVLLLMMRRRKQKAPSIESAFGPPMHDATAKEYVDPDTAGRVGLPRGFEVDDAPNLPPGSTPDSDSSRVQSPAIPPSELEDPLPPTQAAAFPKRGAEAVVAVTSPFASAPTRTAASTSGDHVRKIVAGLLEGQGDFSGPEMRRLELLRPERVLQAISELEPTITGRNKGLTLARLAKIRQHAELLATGAPAALPDGPTTAPEIAAATPSEEPMWQEPANQPTTAQLWQEPVVEPFAEPVVDSAAEPPWPEPAVEPAWSEPAAETAWPEPVMDSASTFAAEQPALQEHFEERLEEHHEEQPEEQLEERLEESGWQESTTEQPAQSPVAPEWEDPIAEAPAEPAPEPPAEPAPEPPGEPIADTLAEPVWQEGLPGGEQDQPSSWQDSLTLPPTETIVPAPYPVNPEAEGTPAIEPVFQRGAPRNDSHWLPTASLVRAAPADQAPDEPLDALVEQPPDDQPVTLEPPAETPAGLDEDWGAPGEPPAEPAEHRGAPAYETPAEPNEHRGAPGEPVSVDGAVAEEWVAPGEPTYEALAEPSGEIEAFDPPGSIPDTWHVDGGPTSATSTWPSAESVGIDGNDARELEPHVIEISPDRIEQESHALPPLEETLEPLELHLETAEDVLALDEVEQTDALAFLSPAELGRVFTATAEKHLKLSVIDLLSHQGTTEAMNALDMCLDDPDADVQLYALDAAERLLGEM